MKKKWIAVLSLGVFMVAVASCGQAPQSQVEVVELSARDERMQDFNNQLTNISDEASAANAINSFANYVEGTSGASGLSANSVQMFSTDTVSRLAKLEMKTRQSMACGISAAAAEEEGLITVDRVTGAVNEAKDSSVRSISTEEVQFIQAGIRSELPGIIPSTAGANLSSGIVTPIESLVIGYVLASGDDGSADPGGKKDLIPGEKVNTYVEKVIE